MTITTNRNQTFEVNWAWAPVMIEGKEALMFELTHDIRPISQIAKDFEGLTHIHRANTVEGDMDFDNYGYLQAVSIFPKGAVRLTLFKNDEE